ncbi:MAG: hypothetical protein IT373_28425 [Polyangiaceae bacterium]|nr:hypothetical protein [Polyangiaceae bacterium]
MSKRASVLGAALLGLTVLGLVAVGCSDGGVGKDGDVVGGSCATTDDCAGGSTCLAGTMYPDGTCTMPCVEQAECPDGSVCVQESGGTCLLTCSSPSDCRDGYGCIDKSTRGPDGHALVCIR